MSSDSNNLSYFKWNELLTNYFFKNEFNNQLVFLCITKKDLDILVKKELGIDNGSMHFINQIIKGPEFFDKQTGIITNALKLSPTKYSSIASLLKRDERNIVNFFDQYPPYLSYLVFFSLAEMEVINAGPHAYYDKVFSLINNCFNGTNEELNKLFPKNTSQQSNQMASIGTLWKELEIWSQKHNKGDFIVYRGNYQSHASKARVNAILNYSERSNIFQILRQEYDKELLPTILDVAPAIQRYSAANLKYFRADLIFSNNQTATYEKLKQNAIYNIIINDIKNEFSKIKIPNNKSCPNIIGFIRERNFPYKSTVSHFLPDTLEEINRSDNNMVIDKWSNGGYVSIEDQRYNIKRGNIKIFTRNKKSFEISGNPFRQVNRIIYNGGSYIIGINNSIYTEEFENWLKRQDRNYYKLEIDFPENWMFYKVKNPIESYKPLGITIHDNTQDSFSKEQPQIELLHGTKIANRIYLSINPPDIILTNFHSHFLNKTYILTARAFVKSTKKKNIENEIEVKIEPFEDYHELTLDLINIGFDSEIEISLVLYEDNESKKKTESFKIIKGSLSKSAWTLSNSNSGFDFDCINEEIQNDIISYFHNPSIDINEKNSDEILKSLGIFQDVEYKDKKLSASYLAKKLKLILKDINDLWEVW
jgi:hypothetical protein